MAPRHPDDARLRPGPRAPSPDGRMDAVPRSRPHAGRDALATRGAHRLVPALRLWPLAFGVAFGAFMLLTDDQNSVEGMTMPLVIATATYALVGFLGQAAWSWSLLGVVVVINLVGEALAPSSGLPLMAALTVAAVVAGLALRRWSAPAIEMRWQPWGAAAFMTAALATLWLDAGAGRVVIALSLLGHAAWDIVHWRRGAVVSHSFAQWCAFLDLTLGAGILVLDFAW